MGKKSTPAPPDYTAIAQQQAQASQDQTTQQNWANRPTVNTPWGSQTWNATSTIDPSTGKPVTSWEQNIQLSPQQQQALDSQMAIQQGRSQGAQSLLNQSISAFQNPIDYNALPQGAQSVQAQQLGASQQANPNMPVQSVGQSGNIQQNLGWAPGVRMNAGQQGQLQNAGNIQQNANQQGQIASAGNIQQQLSQSPADFRTQAQQAVWDLQAPQLQQRRSQIETQLANQGIPQGSEAWNNAMRQVGDEEARARLQGIQAGQQESALMFGQDLQSGQFVNQAQQQQFGQNLTGTQLANQAALTNAQFGNQAQQQQYGQNLTSGQFANQAALTNAQFANQGQQQQFGQNLQRGEFGNQAQNQQFTQNLAGGQFQNQAAQQQFQNLMALAQQGDQRAAQQLQMEIQAGNFNQQLRQQSLTEQQGARSQTLNELNALLSGQQVQNPQMPNFSQAQRAETPQLLNAANMGYQGQVDAFNAQQAANASNMNGLFQLGGTAASLFFLSDRRLKRDITPLFRLENGIMVYKYRFIGSTQMEIGVIAQEVQEIMPTAVHQDSEGYLRVDYNKVLS